MEKSFLQREWGILLVLCIPFIYLAFIWNQLPDIIPTHFNLQGKPDAYGSKVFGTLLLPGINVLLYFLLLFIPRIDPRYKNYSIFKKSYHAIRMVIHFFFSVIAIIIFRTALTGSTLSVHLIFPCVFLLLAFMGNYMRTVRPNFFIGIRTPWTLSSDEVWRKTHELGGRTFFIVGILCFLLSLLLPFEYDAFITLPGILIMLLVPIIYSYLLYRKIKPRQ
jgi:uncharacterized membrane protein